jgi:hypothetical protein
LIIHGADFSQMRSSCGRIREVIVLSLSASAVSVLKDEGSPKSETFQKFQFDPLIQDVARGCVLWVDEA